MRPSLILGPSSVRSKAAVMARMMPGLAGLYQGPARSSSSPRYYNLSPSRCLFVYAVFLREVHHGLDILRHRLIKE
jgi:hypothetical protein